MLLTWPVCLVCRCLSKLPSLKLSRVTAPASSSPVPATAIMRLLKSRQLILPPFRTIALNTSLALGRWNLKKNHENKELLMSIIWHLDTEPSRRAQTMVWGSELTAVTHQSSLNSDQRLMQWPLRRLRPNTVVPRGKLILPNFCLNWDKLFPMPSHQTGNSGGSQVGPEVTGPVTGHT